ncbi:MAG: pseudouridine synthase [Bacilli bacterium]|nr:pseudouridine synthase [Bacilli bacterium]MDY4052556.1 pseudouridine synthase [Bacilli bacterium]
MRLDKYISDMVTSSRKEAKKLINKKRVKVNGEIILDEGYKVNEHNDIIMIDEKQIIYQQFHYYILNKPKGLVTSTLDENPTVMSLIHEYPKYNLAPVGRLDKDTEGLLLITDDGILSHLLTSPKHHVDKTYYVELLKDISISDIQKLEEGIILDDGYKTKEARVKMISPKTIELTIHEGKYHQVKRMLESVNNKVTYLKRISFGPLNLGNLELGTYRELTEKEVEILNKIKNKSN